MMPYYAAIMKTVDKEQDKMVRTEHIEYLNHLIKEGKIFAKGPFTDGSGGLIIFHVASYEEAKHLADQDPVTKVGSRTFEIKKWKSSLSTP